MQQCQFICQVYIVSEPLSGWLRPVMATWYLYYTISDNTMNTQDWSVRLVVTPAARTRSAAAGAAHRGRNDL